MFAALIVWVVTQRDGLGSGGLLASPSLQRIGKVPYAMYVFQVGIDIALEGIGFHPRYWNSVESLSLPGYIAYFSVATLVTFTLATVSWHALEKHFLRLKQRVHDGDRHGSPYPSGL